ncbi:hypothetical protein PT974_04444 [Cladobotryum mycophilum]|uniref:F-box domain-containing protein n=1 Tax=Cladobotryum mycophilum TaxID=491253 RepID=A0ABR0SWA0_9HYPO
MHLPSEILHSIAEFAGTPNLRFLSAESPRAYDRLCRIEIRTCNQRLGNLRLVNKAFCQVASELLFRKIAASCDRDHCLTRLTRLGDMSLSPYASCVRSLVLGIHFSSSGENSLIYAQHLAEHLPTYLERLPNLRTLSIDISQREFLADVTKRIVIGGVLTALASANLPRLQELTVALPFATDFSLFFSEGGQLPASAKEAFSRIRTMDVKVMNWRSLRVRHAATETHGSEMFKLAQCAENLSALEVSGPNQVILDKATMPTSRPLKTLHLNNISFSLDTLRNLLNSCKSSLNTIQFYGTGLSSGTWKDALLEMSKLPNIQDVFLQAVTYSLKSRGREVVPNYRLSMGETTVARDDLDLLAVEILQRCINANRVAAGLPEIDEERYSYDREETLQDAIEALRAEQAKNNHNLTGLSPGLLNFI